jgi:anthranilate synthase/aminodeoxychorismate synthase-like glutamine amidotransferase
VILVLDNYDSFTYNLVQLVGEQTAEEIQVYRNDQITPGQVQALAPSRLLISPGPGRPEDAGITVELVRRLTGRVPILGVCLGHQALAVAFGGRVVRAGRLVHGKTSRIYHDDRGVFSGLANPFEATRYHSLLVAEDSLPPVLEVTAWTSDGEIMGLRHREHPVEGVQFHPESILTPEGRRLLRNFLALRLSPGEGGRA